jgi:hypothetical protein
MLVLLWKVRDRRLTDRSTFCKGSNWRKGLVIFICVVVVTVDLWFNNFSTISSSSSSLSVSSSSLSSYSSLSASSSSSLSSSFSPSVVGCLTRRDAVPCHVDFRGRMCLLEHWRLRVPPLEEGAVRPVSPLEVEEVSGNRRLYQWV